MPAQMRLLVRDGAIGDIPTKILIDSGAPTKLVKHDLASKVLSALKVQACRFDVTWSLSQATKRGKDTVTGSHDGCPPKCIYLVHVINIPQVYL